MLVALVYELGIPIEGIPSGGMKVIRTGPNTTPLFVIQLDYIDVNPLNETKAIVGMSF